mgnify:CR=1 FL=1
MPGGTDVLRALKSAVKTFEDPAAFVVAAWTDVLEDLPDAAGLEALGLDQDVRRAYDKVKECMKRLMSATSAVDEALATATTGRTTWRATSR